jgi:hypothetical protein
MPVGQPNTIGIFEFSRVAGKQTRCIYVNLAVRDVYVRTAAFSQWQSRALVAGKRAYIQARILMNHFLRLVRRAPFGAAARARAEQDQDLNPRRRGIDYALRVARGTSGVTLFGKPAL